MADPRAILVFRNGQIGNTLVAVPALRALRKRFPAARIDVVVDALAGETLRDCPYIDERILYERRETQRFLARHLALVRRLRAGRYDLALLFKRFFRNEALAWLAGARRRAGFRSGGHRPFGLHLALPYDPNLPVWELNLRLLDALGVPRDGDQLEFWSHPAAGARFAELLGQRGWPPDQAWVAVHAGGGTIAGGGLPLEHYLALAQELQRRAGLASVWLFGPREEAPARRAAQAAGASGLVLAGEPLAVAGEAIRRAAMFIGQDSGPSHLAEALGRPAAVVYDDRRPDWEANLRRWGRPSALRLTLLAGTCDPQRLPDIVLDHLQRHGPRPGGSR
jgi:ADP-heptose:LPS heptosyltransferase